MLIKREDVEISTMPFAPGSYQRITQARFTVDISEVLPYLNATLPGAVYHFGAQVLTYSKCDHTITFQTNKIAINNVADRYVAEEELRTMIDLVNRTWECHTEITPDITFHQHSNPFPLFMLLPRTDCKRCGETTCYAFALKLTASQKKLTDCPPLSSTFFASNRSALEALVVDFPGFAYGKEDG